MNITVKRIEKQEWKDLAVNAHLAVFNESWTLEDECIDYALLTVDESNMLVQYATISESGGRGAFIEYGGSFESYKGTVTSFQSFKAILDYLFSKYKKVNFSTHNKNFPMLKFAIKENFYIIGNYTSDEGKLMLIHSKTRED